MSNLPDYISSTRMPAPTPDSIVENGKVHFGTFAAPFKNLNLLDAVKPCGNKMPDFMKPSRLVEWEAFEVHMDEGALISAVYSTGPMGFSIFVWYDKKENKIYSWRNLVPKKKAHVASQLVDDCCYCKTKTSEYKIENDFLHGKARAKGFTKGKNGEFTIDVGTSGGVTVGDPVITSAGLVGVVKEVGLTYSRVRTVLDQLAHKRAEHKLIVNGYADAYHKSDKK